MNSETKIILSNIETYLATGHIPDDLIPCYDQHGRWLDTPTFRSISIGIRTLPVSKNPISTNHAGPARAEQEPFF